MGYTHYWRKEEAIDETEYVDAVKDCIKIIRAGSPLLTNGRGDPDTFPEIANNRIMFNGVDLHCETFVLARNSKDMQPFEFCKTRRFPYDLVVTACLTRLAEVKGIKVSSDGSGNDWLAGVKLASKVLERKLKNPIVKGEYNGA